MTGGRANGMRLFEDVWGRVAVITKVLTSSECSYQMANGRSYAAWFEAAKPME